MGLLERMVRRSKERREVGFSTTPPLDPADCWHLNLSPRWQNAEDMGKEELAYKFECPACGSTMTPDEARAVRTRR